MSRRRSAALRLLPPLRPSIADFQRRGFRHDNAVARALLERRARSFLAGYGLTRRHGVGELEARLADLSPDDRGFGYEGAAFAAAAADLIRPGRRKSLLADLFAVAGDRYPHLMHVGAGWVGLLTSPTTILRHEPLDPLLRWLAVDGAGFARAFLRGPRWTARLAAAPWTADPVRAALYQGVGRCMWFMECADVAAIRRRIATFPEPAHVELWAGVGLAVTYAGAAERPDLAELTTLTGAHRHALAQGAAFAAGSRQIAGHVPDHTRTALLAIAGVSVEVAVDWTNAAARDSVSGVGAIEGYRAWQAQIRALAARHC